MVIGAGRERPYVRAMSVGAAMNVGLNLILIPRLGIIGAAISTLVSETLVLMAGITQMIHVTGHLEVRWRAIRQAGATAGVAGSVALLLRHEAGFVAAALGAIVVYAAVIAFRTARDPRWLNAWLENP